MRKNLFLQSFKHLEKQAEEKEQVVNSVIFEKEPKKSKEEEIYLSEEKEHKGKKNPYAIYLGKGQIFLNPDVAYQELLNMPIVPLPEKYRNSLTKAFFNGTETGQINSLFKDWKKYRIEILNKIAEYFQHIKENPDTCPLGKKYASFVIQNYTPVSEETFAEGAVDLWFFKFWSLFKFYVTSMKGR